MKDITKTYTNGEVTIIWQPARCIHSKICWNKAGLPAVFNPMEKPWIKPDAADTNTITAQVDKCPSGALSWHRNDTPKTDESAVPRHRVEVLPKGPLMVFGDITVKLCDGSITTAGKSTAFCRCGASSNKPYCDGTHEKIEFEG